MKKESMVFHGVKFEGAYRDYLPSVTYRDEGILPFNVPSFRLKYDFGYADLVIESGRNFRGDDLGTNWVLANPPRKRGNSPRDIYDDRLDTLYEDIIQMLRNSQCQMEQSSAVVDGALKERYSSPRQDCSLLTLSVSDYADFHRHITIPSAKFEVDGLEQAVTREFGIWGDVERKIGLTTIYLSNGVVQVDENFPYTTTIIGRQHTGESHKDVTDFVSNYLESVSAEPEFDPMNPNLRNSEVVIDFRGEVGHPIIEEAFREDIDQIRSEILGK